MMLMANKNISFDDNVFAYHQPIVDKHFKGWSSFINYILKSIKDNPEIFRMIFKNIENDDKK
ncbi:MAG: hypothetical protein ACE5J4_02315 [Candidatus Aenigmatarchaeota archaeon]